MKKVFLLFAFTTTFFAQAQYDVAHKFALTAGLNLASLQSYGFKSHAFPGYDLGASVDFLNHKTYAIEFNFYYNRSLQFVDYTKAGAKNDYQGYDVETFNTELMYNRFLIPIEKDEVYLGIQGGGFFNLMFDKWNTLGDADTSGQKYSNGLTPADLEKISKANYGLNIGAFAGYNQARLVFKYNAGLTNVLSDLQNGSNTMGQYTGPKFKGKMNTFSLTLYIFVD